MMRTVWIVFLLLGSAFASGAKPLRVAVAVDAPDRGAGWQAMITAQLSQRDIAVVERENLAGVLAEQEAGGVTPRPISNVDVFLHFRRVDSRQWLIEGVDASSGRLLGSVSATAANPDAAGLLAKAAAGLLERTPIATKEAPRLAVVETGPRDTRLFLLATRLREALAGVGFTVLDRALTQGVVEEKSDAEHGWREGLSDGAFLRADVFVELAALNGQCSVRVFRSRDGKLIESRAVTLEHPDSIGGILRGLLPALDRPAEAEAASYLPTVETEALEPFYRGLALYDEGRYAEATTEFSRAFLLNDKFRDALLWEARCYDALGLPQLAAAVHRYEEVGLVGNGASGSARTSPAEAVAFLGIAGGPSALSAAAASALCRTDREIRLSDDLARLRREYDWLAGLSGTEGARWEQAPSFFCRLSLSGVSKTHGNTITVVWTLTDTASGKAVARREMPLSADPKNWPEEIAGFLPAFLASAVESATAPPVPSAESPKFLEQTLRASRGLDANAALVKLALVDPANPLLRVKGFERGQSKRDGLDAILNFALRDVLLERLPPDSPMRPWLELARIYSFLETEPVGRLAIAERPDVIAELEKFAAANPSSPAALAARYSLLYERQDEMPPAELARACEALLADMRGFPQSAWLGQMTSSLRDYARVADGQPGAGLPDTGDKNLPRRIRIKWTSDGSPELERFSDWSADGYAWVRLSPQEKETEARAALVINGRIGDRRKIQDRWLDDFPHSMTLAAFVVSALHELNFWHGKPLVHPLDWEAERAAFLLAIDYAADTLDFWLGRAETASHLDQIENTVWAFFMALNERVYLGVLPDEKYLAIRDRLVRRIRETNERLGRSGWAWRQPRFLAWQDVTPAQARELRKDRLNDIGPEIYDRDALSAEIQAAGRRAWEKGTFDPQPLWTRLRGWDINDAFTAPELAAFYLSFTPAVLRQFQAAPPNARQMGDIIEHAIALLNGGARPEAEKLFRIVLEGPQDDATAPLRANAAFRLAQILRADGRGPEAIEMARRGLEISGPTSWALIGKLYDAGMQRDVRNRGVAGGLSAHLTRLLGELRFDPASAELLPGIGIVRVPTPNLDNPVLNVFYRVPAGKSDIPRRVLVIVPSLNHDVLDICQPGSPWARFADERNLVLVAPRFYATERAERAVHAFTYFQNAQIWSGKALLAALDKIAERTPIQTDRLLFHGYGAGAGFAARFARWRPDRVAAVSLHGGGMSLPWFQEYPGLLPLSASKNVRFLVTAGENDDYAENTQNRFACAEAFATVLRGAGATVEWKPFPGVGHFPTPEMENASREFLGMQ